MLLIFSIFPCSSSVMSFVSSDSGEAVNSFNTKSWNCVSAALCSGDKYGWRKLNIDETNFPDACNIHCVEMVKIISTAKWRHSAGSLQFDNCSNSACLWHNIKFLRINKGEKKKYIIQNVIKLIGKYSISTSHGTCLSSYPPFSKSFRTRQEHFLPLLKTLQLMYR